MSVHIKGPRPFFYLQQFVVYELVRSLALSTTTGNRSDLWPNVVWGDYPLAVRSSFSDCAGNLTNGTSPKAQANKLPPPSVTHAGIATAAGSRENSLETYLP